MEKEGKFLNKCYIFLVCIYMFMSILNSTYIDDLISIYTKIFNLIQIFLIFCFAFLFLTNLKISRKRIVMYYIFLVLLLVILSSNNDKLLIMLVLMILAYPKKLELSFMLNAIIKNNILAIIITIILSKTGLITDYTFVQRNVTRHSLGFVSANALANIISATVMLHLIYKKDKWNMANNIIWLTVLLFIQNVTNSRLAFIIGLLTLLFANFNKQIIQKERKPKYIFEIAKYIFPVLLIFMILITIYCTVIPYNDFLYKINEMFTGRLNQMINFYKKYGIHLIGKSLFTIGIKTASKSGAKWTGIDTSYINYTLRYGILFMTVVALLYIKLGSKLKKKNMIYEAVYIIGICVMGITENILIIPYYNFAIFMIAKMLKENNKVKEKQSVEIDNV